jgi:hypothetical protein
VAGRLVTSESARYLASRLITTALVILGAMLLLFTLGALVPGDPATALLGRRRRRICAALHPRDGARPAAAHPALDLSQQCLSGNLGVDVITGRPVTGIIGGVIGYTLVLTASAHRARGADRGAARLLCGDASRLAGRPLPGDHQRRLHRGAELVVAIFC